jgi:hypothetical protein
MKFKFIHQKNFSIYKKSFFKKKINLLKKFPKTLIISGGSRNGNHLIWSLLDGNKNLPTLAGEDKFLSSIFKFQNYMKLNKKRLKGDIIDLITKLSGGDFNKWERLYNENLINEDWAGYKLTRSAPLLEFPKFQAIIFYPKYLSELKRSLTKSSLNFVDLYTSYIKAFNRLSNKKKNYKIFKYIYAESGLRKEILYLLKNKANITVIVPIRRFESYYFSKSKNMFNSTKIKKDYLNEIWPQWKNKTMDYLYLKKKYPNNIILIKFEDLENIKFREFYIKKILKIIDIKYSKINLVPTSFGKKVLPNSSFKEKISKLKKEKKFKNKEFHKKFIPKNYELIYEEISKLTY